MTKGRGNSKSNDPSLVDEFDSDLHAAVRKSMGHLLPMMDPELAEVFRRAELLGQRCTAVATSLGISVGTAESRLQAARIEMQRLLELSAQSYVDHSPRRDS